MLNFLLFILMFSKGNLEEVTESIGISKGSGID